MLKIKLLVLRVTSLQFRRHCKGCDALGLMLAGPKGLLAGARAAHSPHAILARVVGFPPCSSFSFISAGMAVLSWWSDLSG